MISYLSVSMKKRNKRKTYAEMENKYTYRSIASCTLVSGYQYNTVIYKREEILSKTTEMQTVATLFSV